MLVISAELTVSTMDMSNLLTLYYNAVASKFVHNNTGKIVCLCNTLWDCMRGISRTVNYLIDHDITL